MEKMLNKVQLIGNIGKDPEIRSTPGGALVAKFSLATTERFTDKAGAKQERTEWHNIVAWEKTASIIEKYAKKGTFVYVEGSLRTDSWDDKASGTKKYRTEVIINTVKLLGSKPAGATVAPAQDDEELPF